MLHDKKIVTYFYLSINDLFIDIQLIQDRFISALRRLGYADNFPMYFIVFTESIYLHVKQKPE